MSATFPYSVSDNRAYARADALEDHFQQDIHVIGPEYLNNYHSSRPSDFYARKDVFQEDSSRSRAYHGAHNAHHPYYGAVQHRSASISVSGDIGNVQTHVIQDMPSEASSSFQHEAHDLSPLAYEGRMSQTIPSVSTPSPSSPTHSPEGMSTIPANRKPSVPSSSGNSKSRKEKPRIELAPDQPLTTQGKPRTRVYVACVQCRSRKIRCDGAKPTCHNCVRRTENGSSCSYDAAPKRRGPDKMPGARQRSAASTINDGGQPHRRARKRESEPRFEDDDSAVIYQAFEGDAHEQSVQPSTLSTGAAEPSVTPRTHMSALRDTSATSSTSVPNDSHPLHGTRGSGDLPSHSSHPQGYYEDTRYAQAALAHAATSPQYLMPIMHAANSVQYLDTVSYTLDDDTENLSDRPAIGAEPSIKFVRETWWDALLSLYSTPFDHPRGHLMPLSPGLREAAIRHIIADFRSFFRHSCYWFAFLNATRIFDCLRGPDSRTSLQPSLVLAALAISTFYQSSEEGQGAQGRDRALKLRDEAQSAFEVSLSTRWIDENLVQASWLLAFFEISAHPLHSSERVRSSIAMLDALIRYLSLTNMDADDSRVSMLFQYGPYSSTIGPQRRDTSGPHMADGNLFDVQSSQNECPCSIYTLGQSCPGAVELTPMWSGAPGWSSNWSEGEIKKEEYRRLVWSSVILASGYSSYTTAMAGTLPLDLFILNPANYALLFPGETLIRATPRWSKHSVWALYMRTLLVWNNCIRLRSDDALTYTDKAQYALAAWKEVDTIEEALARHTCDIERTFMFVNREYLFISRMFLFADIQRYMPQANVTLTAQLVHRHKAEEWLTHQASMARRAMQGLHTITGQPASSLSLRPFYLFWFMGQISRILTLWSSDNSLSVAWDACKASLRPVDYLMALWPCTEQRRRFGELQKKLTHTTQ
ncbi:hypothetical protein AcW1_007456 [Taiwanofungus camphoratus]|nr:hypothetical protein AcW2_007486 [Antrodia cinnamomea]KAI0953163.1 hypothetical protein AcW1_007456 [Antrodia cinnamomea]